MRNRLEFHGLADCLDSPCKVTDETKLKNAKARIVLSINESLFVHVQTLTISTKI